MLLALARNLPRNTQRGASGVGTIETVTGNNSHKNALVSFICSKIDRKLGRLSGTILLLLLFSVRTNTVVHRRNGL